MLPKYHIIFSVILSIFLYFFANFELYQIILFLMAAVLIDVDHYVHYIIKKKDWNIARAYNYFLRKITMEELYKLPPSLHFFHTIEFLIIIALLTIINTPIFGPILLGLSFHMFLDVIYFFLFIKTKKYNRVFSFVWYIIRR